jgi:NADPH2:quinone reductase
MTKDATIFGMSLFNSTRPDVDDIHAAIFDGLSNGFLSPIVRESIPLSDAARSHREVIDTKAFGKIVLVP